MNKYQEALDFLGTRCNVPNRKNYFKRENSVKVLQELIDKQEIDKPILDKKEKEYLENVIRPFKDRAVYILKRNETYGEWIKIHLDYDYFSLPYFEKGTMYKGMKLDEQYTLKELGLFEDEQT